MAKASNEGTPTNPSEKLSASDEETLTSTDMKAVLKVSPEGLTTLDKKYDGAASKLKAWVEEEVTNRMANNDEKSK